MARSMSNKDGMSGGKPSVRKSIGSVGATYKMGVISVGAAIKAAQSAADLAKMGFKVVPIPGKKKK
jgi:hypothetical protein